MSLFDCFIYNNEELLLDLRLNYLNNKVKKFIIAESRFTHQGKEKKEFLDLNKFSKFKNKIVHLYLEKFPENLSNWERENYQRNFLETGFNEVTDEDYLMISDLDEIPNLDNLSHINKYKYTAFEQGFYYYKFNLLNSTSPKWYGTKLCKKKNLISPQWLRNQKVKKFSLLKFYKIRWNIIKKGGWHFSYLMTPAQIKNKIESFSHAEFNTNQFTDINYIKNKIENRLDLFNRNEKFEKIEIDNNFPKIISNNVDKYKEWVI